MIHETSDGIALAAEALEVQRRIICKFKNGRSVMLLQVCSENITKIEKVKNTSPLAVYDSDAVECSMVPTSPKPTSPQSYNGYACQI